VVHYIQPLFVYMTLISTLIKDYLCNLPLFYASVFWKSKHNKGLPERVHLCFLTCAVERGQLGSDYDVIYSYNMPPPS